MKQISKVLGMFVAMMLMATSVWAAGTVIVTKKLNGTVNADAGTVEYNVSETDNVCTLTVTPASGNYVTSAFISAERIVEAVVAHGRRAIGMDGNGQLPVTYRHLRRNADIVYT